MPFVATWVDLENIILSKSGKVSQTQYFTYVESKK